MSPGDALGISYLDPPCLKVQELLGLGSGLKGLGSRMNGCRIYRFQVLGSRGLGLRYEEL